MLVGRERGNIAAYGLNLSPGSGLAGQDSIEGVAQIELSYHPALLAERHIGVIDAASIRDRFIRRDNNGLRGYGRSGGFYKSMVSVHDLRVGAVSVFLGVFRRGGVAESGVDVNERTADAPGSVSIADASDLLRIVIRDGAIFGDEEERLGMTFIHLKGIALDALDIAQMQRRVQRHPERQ